jgi:hypothetical protein
MEPLPPEPRAPARGAALLLPRLLRALALRPETYAEVADDPQAGLQGGIVIVLGGVMEAAVRAAMPGAEPLDTGLVLYSTIAAFIGFLLWSGILWFVGTRLLEHPREFPAVVRGTAFAHSPAVVYGIAVVPPLPEWEGLVRAATLVWFLLALYAATRGIFRLSARRALAPFAIALLGRLLVEAAPYGLRMVPGTSAPTPPDSQPSATV